MLLSSLKAVNLYTFYPSKEDRKELPILIVDEVAEPRRTNKTGKEPFLSTESKGNV